MHNLYFNGRWLSQFGGRILTAPQYELAQRDIERIVIPGKDEEILQDNGRYKNVDFQRKIAMLPYLNGLSARQLANSAIEWLTSSSGYQIYRDTYHPGYFTKAYLVKSDEIICELTTFLSTTLNFSRIAYWYSDEGQQARELTDGVTLELRNPEKTIAKPIIKIVRDNSIANNLLGKLIINSAEINLLCPYGYDYAILNGETMQYIAYAADGRTVFVSDTLPPDLPPGNNLITLHGNRVRSVSIIPNWRRL